MKLSFHEYLDKMRGCWNGKNIGGTLGTPFEGMRGLFDIQYYSQPLDKPLPNDDLDLQLVWLNAVACNQFGAGALQRAAGACYDRDHAA